MTDIIVTFRVKNVMDISDWEVTSDELDDLFRETGEREEMELISWGTI